MQIRKITVENFRGIKKCETTFNNNVVCFVGPGDSCKTTMLDAIELCLLPTWNPRVNDADFFDINPENTICIEAVVGDLPQALLQDDRFGLDLKGWHPENGLINEPDDDTENVLQIRFKMDKSMEPSWVVISTSSPEGKEFRTKDRASIGVTRIGTYVDRQLTWSRNSMVTKIIDDTTVDGLSEALANKQRSSNRVAP